MSLVQGDTEFKVRYHAYLGYGLENAAAGGNKIQRPEAWQDCLPGVIPGRRFGGTPGMQHPPNIPRALKVRRFARGGNHRICDLRTSNYFEHLKSQLELGSGSCASAGSSFLGVDLGIAFGIDCLSGSAPDKSICWSRLSSYNSHFLMVLLTTYPTATAATITGNETG
jgi:hypothetical protein